MKPEETNPMSRKTVRHFLEAVWGKEKAYDLHSEESLAGIMGALHHSKNGCHFAYIDTGGGRTMILKTDAIDYLPAYDNVMGALLHFWKQSK
jgi:hypothetical protein